ncbi:MAG: cupin domain-containing protein [Rhodothermales bacterium]
MMTAAFLKKHLGLRPLPTEGGYFAETYRSSVQITGDGLPEPYEGGRNLATAIYYLLTPDTFSAFHRLAGDEIYHFYLGDPVEQVHLYPDGRGRVLTLGPDLEAGMHLQVVVPGGVWQGSRLTDGGRFALLGTTMAPGFSFDDFQAAHRAALLDDYPSFADHILSLTR